MVLTCVSTAGGGGGGEGSPGRDEEEQEAQKDGHCRIGPVAFPVRENTRWYNTDIKDAEEEEKDKNASKLIVLRLCLCDSVCLRIPSYLPPKATHTCLIANTC